MGGNEIDTGRGTPAVPLIQIAASGEAVPQFGELPVVALPVAPDHIPELAVPLCPQGGELTDLVPAFADIPRLGNQLYFGKDRVLVNHIEKGREAVDIVQFPGQRGGQIKSEPVDVHVE